MERVPSNFNFSTMEKLIYILDEDHSYSTLNKLKNEVNKFFNKASCKEILYTNNSDKLFFGMRVYVMLNDSDAMDIMGDDRTKPFDKYYLEFDSKLFDPVLNLEPREIIAIMLHEIGHIVYDAGSIDIVKSNIDKYFAESEDDYFDLKSSRGYKALLAYAIKDAVMKTGSIFAKFGDEEILADSFVISCGFGTELESGMKKIRRSVSYLNKDVDNRFIALAWVLRLRREFSLKRLPALQSLNKAKQLTGSELEKRELDAAIRTLNRMEDPISESIIDDVRNRFSKKFSKLKANGIRTIRDDVYELNLRLRSAETESDLIYIIRTVNTDIAIIQDYLTDDIDDYEREETTKALQDLYEIRQRAAKDKNVRGLSSSLINVIYPE